MKQGTLITKLVILVMFAAVVFYILASAWRTFNDPFSTVVSYAYTVDDAAETTGYLVRREEVITGESAIVDVLPGQGEKVAAGQTVAYLYRDASALERKRQIRSLELELEQLQYSMQKDATGMDSARLDQSIIDAMVSLKSAAAYGDLTGLEDQALTLKSLVIRREYTVTGGGAGIQALVTSATAQIDALRAASSQDTTPIRVSRSGTFANLADGYEALLTPAALEGLTPSTYKQLTAQNPQAPAGAVGKLVTDTRWYFTAVVPQATAERLIEGRSVTVRFSRDWSGDVSMKVESVSQPENGVCAVVLSSDKHLSDTILLRRQTVDIVFDSVTGVRLPKKALRSVALDVYDPETREVSGQRQATGVFVLTGAQAEFKEVAVAADDGDYYLVKPVDPEARTALRAGDEIIVAAVDLYDGKVVQ